MTVVLGGAPAPITVSGTRRWWALGALGLAVLTVGIDGTVLSVALPTLAKALHASESDLQWFSSGYFLVLAAAMLLGLIPWTIGLAVSLPRTYVTANWRVLWTGFDVVLLGCLAVTAWGLWKQRQILVPASIITSVLLLCDAWFDLLTANGHRDLIVSAASALFGELPLATMLILISIRALRVGARAARALEQEAPLSSLWRTPLITFPGPSKIR